MCPMRRAFAEARSAAGRRPVLLFRPPSPPGAGGRPLNAPVAAALDSRRSESTTGVRTGQTWRPLRYFNYYRIALATIFSVVFLVRIGPRILGNHEPLLFQSVALTYLALALLSAFTIHSKRPAFAIQVNAQVLIDIAALTLMMHASGGLTSGLGILMVVSIAGAGVMVVGRVAMLHAALATLAVLGEQTYAHLTASFDTTAYTQAGLLGITFFATALVAYVLANRARESEALARQRGVDLANLEQVNDYIIRHMQSGVVVVDRDENVRLINDAAWNLLARPTLAREQQLEQLSAPLRDRMRRWRNDGDPQDQPLQAAQDGAQVIPRFAHIGSDVQAATAIFLEDATEANQRLQQLKLASLGRLTASIAHEIRNPLGAISHAAQLLGESAQLDRNDRRLTQIISEHSKRMNAIIENVLQLSRRETSHPRSFTLLAWLHGFAEELQAVQKLSSTQLQIEVKPAELEVHIDPTHLQQVLWNLCGNALEHAAAPDQSPSLQLKGGLSEYGTPYLDVIDNGPGIGADIAEQIFEPFYTTASHGTGLGLYISRELCECNRARLNYLRPATGGSCFRISFSSPERKTA